MPDLDEPKGSEDDKIASSEEPAPRRELNEITRRMIEEEEARRRAATDTRPLHPRTREGDKAGGVEL